MWLKKVKMRSWLVVSLIGLAIVFQSCMKDDGYSYNDIVYEILAEDIATIQEYLEANNIDAEMDSATGVFYTIHKEGDGYKTINGVKIEAHYQGETLDGVEFVNTYSGLSERITLGTAEGNPATFNGGLNTGLLNMNEGDSATIYVPSPFGFQDQVYNNVPANSILVYKVKFEDILLLSEELEKIDQYIQDSSMTAQIEPEYGTRYVIHRAGNSVSPENGAYITTQYQGELLDGTVFDTSYDNNIPLDFTYGQGELIPGFEMGISQLHENDSATIFIPSIYGYGEDGAGDLVPGNAVLIFGLDITRISNPF